MRNRIATTWSPPRTRLIVLVVLLVNVASAYDAVSTLDATSNGFDELNPVMSLALTFGPWLFLAIKTGIVLPFTLLLAAFAKKHRLAWRGLCMHAVVYTSVVIHQIAITALGPAVAIPI